MYLLYLFDIIPLSNDFPDTGSGNSSRRVTTEPGADSTFVLQNIRMDSMPSHRARSKESERLRVNDRKVSLLYTKARPKGTSFDRGRHRKTRPVGGELHITIFHSKGRLLFFRQCWDSCLVARAMEFRRGFVLSSPFFILSLYELIQGIEEGVSIAAHFLPRRCR